MAVAAPPPRSAPHGHTAGTALDDHVHEQHTPLPGLWVALGIFAVAFGLYFLIGYRTTIDQHVIVFDALDRLTRAYLVWHNDPPKLAAVGFLFAPITTFVFLPFTVVKPLATSLVALPLTSALFSAGTLVVLDRALARCDMAFALRIALIVAFALNPMWVFYSGNGMSEVVYAFFLAFSLYCFLSWYVTTEPRFLIGAGFGISILVLTRYAFIIWAALIAILIGIALVRRRAGKAEVEGSVIAFAAPVMYFLALWILFNALIVGEPFGWLTDVTTSTQAVNSTGIDDSGDLSFNDIATRLLELNVIVFPLAFAVVPALVVAFVTQRNDMALWLASLIVLGIVIIGAHAFTAENEGLLTLRDSIPMYVTAFVGAAWAFRSFESWRMLVWAVTLGLLVVNFFTAWQGMKSYPFQSLEQAFVRAVEGGEDQTGEPSRGGYRVGVESEAQMAEYIKRRVTRKNSILTDNSKTFGVMMLTGRPQLFFDRIDFGDTRFRQVLEAPFGRVEHLLLTVRQGSGDIIAQRYPRANQGEQPGVEVVFRTERYILARVERRRPAAVTRQNRTGGGTGTLGNTNSAPSIAPQETQDAQDAPPATTTPTTTTP